MSTATNLSTESGIEFLGQLFDEEWPWVIINGPFKESGFLEEMAFFQECRRVLHTEHATYYLPCSICQRCNFND